LGDLAEVIYLLGNTCEKDRHDVLFQRDELTNADFEEFMRYQGLCLKISNPSALAETISKERRPSANGEARSN
jgi:hypothetical protein